jgi:hypothetical protein
MKILGQFRLVGAFFGAVVCALAQPSIQTTALTYRPLDAKYSTALGTWGIPGPAPTGPAVTGMSPSHSTSLAQTFTFTFTDSNGWHDIGVTNILINGALDGRHACYVAFVPSSASTGSVYLVDDAGDAGGPYSTMALPGTGMVQNSQCAINGTGSSVTGNLYTLKLTLTVTFNNLFAGNQIVYLAARYNTQNSGWQAVGSAMVP